MIIHIRISPKSKSEFVAYSNRSAGTTGNPQAARNTLTSRENDEVIQPNINADVVVWISP